MKKPKKNEVGRKKRMVVVVVDVMMVRFRFAARHSFIHSVVGWCNVEVTGR